MFHYNIGFNLIFTAKQTILKKGFSKKMYTKNVSRIYITINYLLIIGIFMKDKDIVTKYKTIY